MASLPSPIRVLVRGWLNCNQVVLLAPGDNVLVDSGYCTHREKTLELLASRDGLDRQPLERLVNTHCHSDHMGGNSAVASQYGCRITIPEGELQHVVPWTPQSVWMAQFDQRADPFVPDDTIAAGHAFEGGGFTWQAHAAPGHDMDALMYFEPANRVLISGDALWRDGLGFVWTDGAGDPYLAAALATLDAIERLDPAVVIPGHGEPFEDVGAALARARSRLEAFGRDPAKAARHMMKVMFIFALLDRESMPAAELPAYFERVPCYRHAAERFFGRAPGEMAAPLLAELERVGAVTIREGIVRPTMVA